MKSAREWKKIIKANFLPNNLKIKVAFRYIFVLFALYCVSLIFCSSNLSLYNLGNF